MGRRPQQYSAAAYSSDCASLTRIYNRIMTDPARPESTRREMGRNLLAVVHVLQSEMMNGSQEEEKAGQTLPVNPQAGEKAK